MLALMDAQRITAANDAAQALGVKPGIKRATALALAPQLVLGRADAVRDGEALTSVAHAALAFTPAVVLHPPYGVLLDVQSTLRYFGGRDTLLGRLRQALAPLGHGVHVASAPTAQGAALLAQWRDGLHRSEPADLQQTLEAAPLWLSEAARPHRDALQGMGLRTLGELRRLPRAGLARRFGEGLLDELDRAFGAKPDPRTPIELPSRFDSRLELFARADTADQVLHGAAVLLSRLMAWLSARHALVRRFSLLMQHEARWRAEGQAPPETVLEIALAEPSRDAAHMQILLRERLAGLQLAAPTLELRLQAHDIVQRAPPNGELFLSAQSEREGLTRLVERLQARLGREQVQRLVPLQDHRPERAGALQTVDARDVGAARPAPGRRRPASSGTPGATGTPATQTMPARPVWLLAEPRPLPERRSRPYFEGHPLQLLCGPERIESGWWDGALVERDYFIARSAGDALIWVYRQRLPGLEAAHGWFLHGRFG